MPDFLKLFLSSKQLEGLSKESLKYYSRVLGWMCDDIKKPILETTTEDLRTWLATYHKKKAPSKVTLNNMRRVLSSFFGWLESEDFISKSPVRRIHNIKTDKVIKKTLSEKDIDALRESRINLRDKAIIDFLFSTGVRVSELVGLNRSAIDFTEKECVVFGKGSKERIVYFDELTKKNLAAYLNSRNDNNPALFVSLFSPYKRLQKGGIETMLREAGKTVGIDKVHPHKFRRTMATQAAELGMPIQQVQHLLGHVRIDTTMAYVNVHQKSIKNSYREYFE
jgi:site-specific recombinase XerD